MLLEVKILSGAREGKTLRLEKPVISVGRNPDVDVRFDAQKDLDVSGRHAEFRAVGPGYEIHDLKSTNGTFVNGERVEGSRMLRTADTLRFGAHGPEVEVSFHVTASFKAVGSTEERVAYAVKKQTAGLRRMMVFGLGIVAVGLAGAYWFGQRANAKIVEALMRQIAESDVKIRALQNGMPGDTVLANTFTRQLAAARARAEAARTEDERASAAREIQEIEQKLAAVVRMDLVSIGAKNSDGVALLISKIDSQSFAGTAFAITSKGLLLTNRHNVRLQNTHTASDIAIKFQNDSLYYKARIVKISDDPNVDLALLQMDDSLFNYPVVMGIQSNDDAATEGSSVAIIGFPLGYETVQEGEGQNFKARTSLMAGTVSKRTSTVLQLDAFAAHGSSGSPIFSAKGLVVGVLWGGPKEAAGRIVYAVPVDKIIAFLPENQRAMVK